MFEFTFFSANSKLAGTIFTTSNEKAKHPAILFVHGWTSAKERSYQYAEALAKIGYICMLFDMRGHGASEGDINTTTTEEFLDDILAAYDYFINIEGIDKENISVIGSSFGGYLAAILTTKRNVKNLSMRVPADYANDSFNKPKMQTSGGEDPEIFAWRSQPRKPGETFALEALADFNGDVQIIESEKDDVVPHQIMENFASAIKDKSKLTHDVIKNAPHSMKDGPFKDEVERLLVKWFGERI